MAGVRNGCLARVVTTTGPWQSLFTVPTDTAVLLKHVLVFNPTTSTASLFVRLRSADGGVIPFLLALTLAPNAIEEWAGWTGLNHGDHLESNCNVAGVHVWTAGAALPGESGLPLPQTSSVPD